MLSLLILLGVIVLIIISENNRKKTARKLPTTYEDDTNQQWMDYIASYKKLVKKPSERAMLDEMLRDLQEQGMPYPRVADTAEAWHMRDDTVPVVDGKEAIPPTAAASQSGVTAATSTAAVPSLASDVVDQSPRIELDNETLLLYFGAFLFVAAAGLFVGFGTANGSVRLGVVLAVMALMYSAGLWLHANRPKLRIAGLTFVGIGLMMAPLAGVAAYSFLFRDMPQLVWLGTSVLCLGLYGHALKILRNPLLEYVFLGTFLSLFESLVSVLVMPAYYYGWMLAAFGLLLQAWRMYRGNDDLDANQPSVVMSQLLLPISIVTALFMVPSYGALQLGVSATLAAVYYLLFAIRSTGQDTDNYAVVSQALFLGAAMSFAYAYRNDWQHVSATLLLLSVAQLGVYLVRRATSLTYHMATLTLASVLLSTACAWSNPRLVLMNLVWLVLLGVILWIRQSRADAYVLAAWGLIAVPLVYSELIAVPRLSATALAWLVTGTLFVQLSAMYLARRQTSQMSEWRESMRIAYVSALAIAMFLALLAGEWTAVAVAAVIALSTLPLSQTDDKQLWSVTGGAVLVLPLFVTWGNSAAFLTATAIGLVWNIVLALRYRDETNRWFGTGLWLLVPVAVAHQWPSLSSAEYYAIAYVVAATGLLVARAIATGRLLPSSRVPVVSYMQSASVSYVAGYLVAAGIATVSSVVGPGWLTVATALALAVFTYVASLRVERQPDGLAAIPILAQIALWGSFSAGQYAVWFVFGSSVLAVAGYVWAKDKASAEGLTNRSAMRSMSLMMAYIAPVSVIAVDMTWAMPFGLLVAGIMTLDRYWGESQGTRELAGGVILFAVLWWMKYAGVENVQAYTHVIAALLAAYAYWRAKRGEAEESNQYILATLLTTSVPLAIQAISGEGGGLYGWWFLIEQIMIMFVGITIGNRFVIRWGLYAAVFAVLYQLRNLGWAALTFLALFIIGLAVYRLQHTDAQGTDAVEDPDKVSDEK